MSEKMFSLEERLHLLQGLHTELVMLWQKPLQRPSKNCI